MFFTSNEKLKPMAIEKSKSWGSFWSYQLDSTANPAHLLPENGPNRLNWQCFLAGSSKTAPRILIFSIAMGADYSFYVKSIATYAPAFLRHNNSVLARVITREFHNYYPIGVYHEN